MTAIEARDLILAESREGIAYTSRMGDYGTPEHFELIFEAIDVLKAELSGQTAVDRELFCGLFVLGNQVEGNVHGALSRGLAVPEWLWDEGILRLDEAIYGIFADEED